jgi:N4-(beta-N-acetylglucosaminyl)-L-asparaginase
MMRTGTSPKDAIKTALDRIKVYYPNFSGAMVAVTTKGEYGAGSTGFGGFQYTLYNPQLGKSTVMNA